MEDQEIVQRCQQGETQLLDDLVLKHENSLYRFCFYLCGNADTATDLFQETWLKALHNLHKYKAKGAFLGWLFTIAANHYRDYYRKRKRRQSILHRHPEIVRPDYIADHVIHAEEKLLIQQALESLDEPLRIPIILFYFEGYAMDTIADMMQVPVGTVKSRLHRAKKRLKKQLEVLL